MNLKLPKEEVLKRVEEALEYMNISDFKDRPPHYLSGGEKKRVTIAGIIAMKPPIIIFDEPTASLDPINALMLEEVLDKLTLEGKTMLISTHDVDFAYRWAKRVLVFSQGKNYRRWSTTRNFPKQRNFKTGKFKTANCYGNI